MLAVEWPLARGALQAQEACSSPSPPTPAVVQLADAKRRVRDAIAAHGRRAWDLAARSVDPATAALRRRASGAASVVVASRAYHKLAEIVRTCGLPTPRRSLHLCEAPGGFVQALGDDLRERGALDAWRWLAVSRAEGGPAPETACLPLRHGAFVTAELPAAGDLLVPACADAIAARVDDAVDLATADGAAEMDHDHLEREHFPLFVAQINVAVRCLARGGCLVVKFFEGAEAETQACLAWVSTRFDAMSVVKPRSSRPTNSERYLVACGFDGDRSATFEARGDWRVSEAWRRELQHVVDRMATEQANAIENALCALRGRGEGEAHTAAKGM
jgi:23S rRNA U2552 (ribose-2'-O)-methylase RlmE/FtsJ